MTSNVNPRALPPATLESLARQVAGESAPPIELVAEPRAAVRRARELAGPDGAVLATGSIYLVADLARTGTARRASTL
jgi:dihydrofolate synthase / folylpolyglutamate synthase